MNAQLHAVCSWLVCRLGRRLGLAAWPAAVAGLLFAAHPVHCEAVAGIVGRADLLATALALLAVAAYTRHVDWRERGCQCSRTAGCSCRAWTAGLLAATLTLAALAMLCKEPGLTVLVVCATYEFVLQLGRRQRKVGDAAATAPPAGRG